MRGIVVRAPSIGQGLIGAFKSIGGGNIREYAEVCEAARHDAYVQMMQHAEQLGAHAIIGMRYDATELMAGVTEVLAYAQSLGADAVIATRYETTPFAADGVSELLAYGTAVRLVP